MVLRMLVGALVGACSCATVLAAQGPGLVAPDMWSGVSLAGAAGALIAWGSQSERVKSHARRLEGLEQDRVTRAEHEAMRDDIHYIRDLLERRRNPR